MSEPARLRSRAEGLAAPLPPLLADAEHLAATVLLGSHGRRRAGMGDEFWQYRPAAPGDAARSIDWRRSARSDTHFVRETEWQAAQSVMIWVDPGRGMRFTSRGTLPEKGARARLLALALAVLLSKGGERVGLAAPALAPRAGHVQLMRLAEALAREEETPDYVAPEIDALPAHARAVFISDFLGDTGPAEAALTTAADRGVRGAALQILDPQEEAFPFDGRTVFESMGGSLRHETLKAGELRGRYRDRLAARKAHLADVARLTGWRYAEHHTDQPALNSLIWLYGALEPAR